MGKPRLLRAAGFLGALGATAALIGFGVSSTGAYFTDSHSGTITAQTGHLKLDVNNTSLSFTDLVPGTPEHKQITYTTNSTAGNEDIWLVFNTSTQDDQYAYCKFTGPGDQCNGGGLGRYGYFSVANDKVPEFESHNLQNQDSSNSTDSHCTVSSNGHSTGNPAATAADPYPPLCGVPQYIELASNLPNNTTGQIDISFGVTGKWTAQDAFVLSSVPFSIVATQAGVRPDAPNI